MPEGRGAGTDLARNFGPAPFRALLLAAAVGYFGVLLADHVRARGLRSLVPGPILFFAQIADLFPQASAGIIEYRAEGWICGEQRFAEIDMGKLFPMLAGNKENRFYRLMHFYRQNAPVLHALDAYCVRRYPPVATEAGPDRIGGVRFTSLVLPLPREPSEVERYSRKPLSEYPEAPRHLWYRTPARIAAARCSEAGLSGSAAEGSANGESASGAGGIEGKAASP